MTGPIQSKCGECGRVAAETVCSLCKTARAELISLGEIAQAIQNDAALRAAHYADDRNKADRANPPYSTDGDYTVFGGRLRQGQ